MLYLSKRVRPDCLAAVAFLTTRVNFCDRDDLAKLKDLMGYIRNRSIVPRVGNTMTVKAYIDAVYGIHQNSGKFPAGCDIVVGNAGPLKAAKQKIATKSSTEAEPVGLSDTASQAIHI